jgi:putative acetyltransferase
MEVVLREAVPDDAPRVRDLHLASIEALGPQAYSDEQVAAWAHERDLLVAVGLWTERLD